MKESFSNTIWLMRELLKKYGHPKLIHRLVSLSLEKSLDWPCLLVNHHLILPWTSISFQWPSYWAAVFWVCFFFVLAMPIYTPFALTFCVSHNRLQLLVEIVPLTFSATSFLPVWLLPFWTLSVLCGPAIIAHTRACPTFPTVARLNWLQNIRMRNNNVIFVTTEKNAPIAVQCSTKTDVP